MMACADDLEEQVGALWAQGEIAEFVVVHRHRAGKESGLLQVGLTTVTDPAQRSCTLALRVIQMDLSGAGCGV